MIPGMGTRRINLLVSYNSRSNYILLAKKSLNNNVKLPRQNTNTRESLPGANVLQKQAEAVTLCSITMGTGTAATGYDTY